MKSDVEFFGVGLPAMRQVVRALKQEHAGLDRRNLLELVALLWSRPVFERRMMAVLLLEDFEPLLRPADMKLLERLIRESKTWAFVDELAVILAFAFGYIQREGDDEASERNWLREETGGCVYLRLSTRPIEQVKRAMTPELSHAAGL